jgi:acrylyl-CoA reductase (NADPH)
MSPFRAFRIHQEDGKIRAGFEPLTLEQLSPGEVLVRVSHSGINYKDALAATGKGRILRRYPLVGGIDLAGVVEHSDAPAFKAGDAVLVTGGGLSETRDGGYALYARVPAEAVIAMPPGFDAASAMAIGTAGFAAALAIDHMERNGLVPGQGPVAVTGATGGVGAIGIDMLATRGYQVSAITGKRESESWLKGLGASEILLRTEIEFGEQPLLTARWAGAIDNAGGPLLTWLLRALLPGGSVASVGLAGSADLHCTVMPFILRGANLLGVGSAGTPRAAREALWQRISTDLKPRHLDRIVTRTLEFDELPAAFEDYIAGRITGRTVVQIS